MPELRLLDRGSNGPVLYFCADQGEAEAVHAALCAGTERPFRLAAFTVADWNRDLSPWPAPAVFGRQDFAGRAGDTLRWLTDEAIPLAEPAPAPWRCVGGYSLAGLFSLWAFYETGLFQSAVSCSGSLWFPGWLAYAKQKTPPAGSALYLSLGDKEPHTRNRAMAAVDDATRAQQELALRQGMQTVFVWERGGHFQQPEERMARGFAWSLETAFAE